MYENINRHIINKNINSALEECYHNKYIFLGIFLGRITNTNNKDYHKNMNNLYSLLEGGKTVTPQSIGPKLGQISPIHTPSKPIITEKELKELETKLTESKPKNLPTIQEEDLTKVKLYCNWMETKEITTLWSKMSQGDGIWNNLKLVVDEEADYHVIINCPPINTSFLPKNTIYFQMEPKMNERYKLWGDWSNPPDNLFIKACKYGRDYNNVEWHLSKTYQELKTMTIVKEPRYEGVISTILSSKYKDPGHIKRIDFVKFLEKKGMPVHVYGDNKWKYKNYRGKLPYHCKDEGIFPYKYHFNVENHSDRNYFTEKLVDAILGESLCFYNGCSNLLNYLPKEAFIYLHLSNFEHDYAVIQKVIKDNWYSQRLPYIKKAKKIILEELQFFPRIEKIIREHKKKNNL